MSDPNQTSRWSIDEAELARLTKEARQFKGESLWSDAWRRLRRNRTAFFALLFLAAFGVISLLAPFLPIPSPKAISLRDEPGTPEWFWSIPAAPTKAPDRGAATTRATRNLWNNGWRHRSTVIFAANDEGAAEEARARVAEVSARGAVLETYPAEEGAGLAVYASVPMLEGDAPEVDYGVTDIRGTATCWEVFTSGAEEATGAVHSLRLEGADGAAFDPARVSGWSVESRGRSIRLFLSRAEAEAGLGDWVVAYRLSAELDSLPTAVLLDGTLLAGSAAVSWEGTPRGAQTVKAELLEGVEAMDLGRQVAASLAASPIDGVTYMEIRHEDGYWEFKGLVGAMDRALRRARIATFGLWQTGNWMGTDGQGRDLLARIVWGSRTSIIVGIIASLCSLLIGVLYGAFSGYMGGRIDNLMMRIVDVLYSIPFIFVVIFLITVVNEYRTELEDQFGIDREKIFFLVIGAIYWLTMARVVRGQVLSLKNTEFIEAARVIGASTTRILLSHVVPNVLSIVIVYLTLTIPAVMLFEAFLSFLGLGIEPPKVSWGLLAVDGTQAINPIKIYWWLVVFPAAAMGSTLLALNILGDGLRDALDPKLRGKN